MRIDRLSVQNFKGFEARDFEFPRSLDASSNGNGSFHLIIGQNGKGKTTALDALAVAAGSWLLGVRGEDSRHILPGDIRVRVIEFGDTARIERQLPVKVAAHGTVLGQTLEWRREVLSKKTNWVYAKNIRGLAEQAVKDMQSGASITLPLISYYGTGRLWQEPRDMNIENSDLRALEDAILSKMPAPTPEDDLADAFASRLAGYRFSIDPRCSPKDLLRWLKFEEQLALQAKKESNQYRVVKDAIKGAVEGCHSVHYDLRLGLLLEIEGQPRLPFGALSDGQRNMVAMIGDLAFKAAQLNPHLGEDVLKLTPGIVLIDELDLHLHPRWQRHVVEDLRRLFPEVQFIATTHSPFIVQTAREGELISLDSQVLPETANFGIEQIAQGLMGFSEGPILAVSPRYTEMKQAAVTYYKLLDEASMAPDDKLRSYLDDLAAAQAPYADNPAFQAFLELKREARLGERLQALAKKVSPNTNGSGNH